MNAPCEIRKQPTQKILVFSSTYYCHFICSAFYLRYFVTLLQVCVTSVFYFVFIHSLFLFVVYFLNKRAAMAEYFKLPLGNQQNYIEIKLRNTDGAGTTNCAVGNGAEIICCVDTSGSMAGNPINSVHEVLRDIYQRTKKEYRIFTYNTETAKLTLKTLCEQKSNLKANGGTSFACIFNAIKDYLLQNSSTKQATTFIFMTDGQDNEPTSLVLKKSIEMLKLVMSGMTNVS